LLLRCLKIVSTALALLCQASSFQNSLQVHNPFNFYFDMAFELLSFCTSCSGMAFTFSFLWLCLASFINQPQPQLQQQQQHHTNLTPLMVRPSSSSVKSMASASATRLATLRQFGISTSEAWQPSRTGNPSTHRHWGISALGNFWGGTCGHLGHPGKSSPLFLTHFSRRCSHRSPSSIHGRGWYMRRTSTAP
jgi:hypothetical protein